MGHWGKQRFACLSTAAKRLPPNYNRTKIAFFILSRSCGLPLHCPFLLLRSLLGARAAAWLAPTSEKKWISSPEWSDHCCFCYFSIFPPARQTNEGFSFWRGVCSSSSVQTPLLSSPLSPPPRHRCELPWFSPPCVGCVGCFFTVEKLTHSGREWAIGGKSGHGR